MKRFIQLALFSVAIGSACVNAGPPQADIYHVSEMVRIITPVSFECRIRDFPDAPQTRFQVFFKGAAPVPDNYAVALAQLNKSLRSAANIELRRVKVRNYFRLEAEVWIDGEDLAAKLLAQNLIRPKEVLVETRETDVTGQAVGFPARLPSPQRRAVSEPTLIERPKYGLQRLIETKIDLSSLTSETPLAEALKQVSDSLGPHLPMVVFWSDVQNNAFLEKDSPIGVEGFGVISAAQALDAILYSVSGYGVPLKFTISDGILKIGTVKTLSQRTTEVYSVLDLVSAPSHDTSETGNGSGFGGSGNSTYSSGTR